MSVFDSDAVLHTSRLPWLIAGLLALVLAVTQLPGFAQSATDDPLPTVAFVARADNPVDALAASGVAGAMGGTVLLTPSAGLDDATRQALIDLAPDLVVLAGGEGALSPGVEQAIQQIPLETRRVSGPNRIATAVALGQLAAELGFGRPVLTGATVEGDAGLAGTLSVEALEVGSTDVVTGLNADRLDSLDSSDFWTKADDVDAATLGGQTGDAFAPVDHEHRETVTRHTSCSAAAFSPLQHSTQWSVGTITTGSQEFYTLRRSDAAGSVAFWCSIDPPVGALLTELAAEVYDSNNGAEVGPCGIRRNEGATGTNVVAQTGATGVAAAPGRTTLTAAVAPENGLVDGSVGHHIHCLVGGNSFIGLLSATVAYEIVDVPTQSP
jgi:hypothetical protein